VTDEPDLERAARELADGFYHENIEPGLNGFWVEAKDLRPGDVFLGANGELSMLTNAVRVEQEGGIAVFNFTVEGNHNYFILAKEYEYGQTCVLVHNACKDPGHHALPKFLGGNPKQKLIDIPKDVHVELHKELIKALRAKGFTLPVGGKNGSTKIWEQFFKRNPGEQRKAWDAVLDVSRAMDAKHGTNITHFFWKNFY